MFFELLEHNEAGFLFSTFFPVIQQFVSTLFILWKEAGKKELISPRQLCGQEKLIPAKAFPTREKTVEAYEKARLNLYTPARRGMCLCQPRDRRKWRRNRMNGIAGTISQNHPVFCTLFSPPVKSPPYDATKSRAVCHGRKRYFSFNLCRIVQGILKLLAGVGKMWIPPRSRFLKKLALLSEEIADTVTFGQCSTWTKLGGNSRWWAVSSRWLLF